MPQILDASRRTAEAVHLFGALGCSDWIAGAARIVLSDDRAACESALREPIGRQLVVLVPSQAIAPIEYERTIYCFQFEAAVAFAEHGLRPLVTFRGRQGVEMIPRAAPAVRRINVTGPTDASGSIAPVGGPGEIAQMAFDRLLYTREQARIFRVRGEVTPEHLAEAESSGDESRLRLHSRRTLSRLVPLLPQRPTQLADRPLWRRPHGDACRPIPGRRAFAGRALSAAANLAGTVSGDPSRMKKKDTAPRVPPRERGFERVEAPGSSGPQLFCKRTGRDNQRLRLELQHLELGENGAQVLAPLLAMLHEVSGYDTVSIIDDPAHRCEPAQIGWRHLYVVLPAPKQMNADAHARLWITARTFVRKAFAFGYDVQEHYDGAHAVHFRKVGRVPEEPFASAVRISTVITGEYAPPDFGDHLGGFQLYERLADLPLAARLAIDCAAEIRVIGHPELPSLRRLVADHGTVTLPVPFGTAEAWIYDLLAAAPHLECLERVDWRSLAMYSSNAPLLVATLRPKIARAA